jgi:hypothetical protein
MFAHVEGAHPSALIEIAYCRPGEDQIRRARMFPNTVEGRQAAAEFGAAMSAESTNVYVAPALRQPGTPHKRAGKGDVLGSPAIWLDFDAPGASDAATKLWRDLGIPPHFVVVTGRAPASRAQAFWVFDGIVEDQAELDTFLAGAHVRLGFVGDPKVVNADRVMRLAGTLSHPKAGEEGRRLEVTGFRAGRAVGAAAPRHDRGALPAARPGRRQEEHRRACRRRRSTRGTAAAPGSLSAPMAGLAGAPAVSAPASSPAALAPAVAHEPERDWLGRRIDGRDEYARDVILPVIRNLDASSDVCRRHKRHSTRHGRRMNGTSHRSARSRARITGPRSSARAGARRGSRGSVCLGKAGRGFTSCPSPTMAELSRSCAAIAAARRAPTECIT